MKRTILYGLAIVGILNLVGGIWWLLAQPSDGEYGPAFFISTSIFLLVFAADLQTETGVEVRILGSSDWLFVTYAQIRALKHRLRVNRIEHWDVM